MNTWFYHRHGKTFGPLSKEELIGQIRKCQLNPEDFVYNNSSNKWIKINEEFDEATYKPTRVIRKDYVILKSRSKLKGPYSYNEIIDNLHTGKIDYHDHVWKKGMKSWMNLNSFLYLKKQKKDSLPDCSTEELLESVVYHNEFDKIPNEALHHDLTKQFSNIKLESLIPIKPIEEEKIPHKTPKELNELFINSNEQKPSFFQKIIFTLLNKKYLAIVFLLFSAPITSSSSPYEVEYFVRDRGREHTIKIENYNKDDEVLIVIKSIKNKVLSKNLFYQEFNLSLNSNKMATLRLDPWMLSNGFYEFYLKAEDIVFSKEFFFGHNLSKFKSDLEKFNDQIL